ncbi:ABC transporter permease [Sporolactobacillus putidus]|uniref:Membrane protein n=1 Tax=Sporolactobacillus putidus TaxID=492735 RepID=A0A917W3T6_9BACL|nr:ABC transporter permease [Sporolactobacillus putidus]GGL60886.1 membrane protein [Sporolactobacillus putidus]
MHSLLTFTAKELKEQFKTFKGVIVFLVLIIFGMTSPLFAKLMPDLLRMAGTGTIIQVPTPTYLDAYAQFFKNIGQLGIIVLILVFSSGIVTETLKGTAQIMLTKQLSRSQFILSKFFADVLVWTLSYTVSAALCVIYTVYLFPGDRPGHLFLALFCMWLYGCLTIAAVILSGTLFKNYALAAVGGFVIWGLINLSSLLPKIKDGAPSVIGSANMDLISRHLSSSAMRMPVLTACLLIFLLLTCACLYFRRREL